MEEKGYLHKDIDGREGYLHKDIDGREGLSAPG